jgi:hypothetical protein
MNKSNDINHILEIFWLIVAIATGFMGLYAMFTRGFMNSYMFFLMAILSILLFLARRNLRLKNARKNK